jgi:hypothetical protein
LPALVLLEAKVGEACAYNEVYENYGSYDDERCHDVRLMLLQ